MSQVQQFGGNTTAVSSGSASYVWNDANNDGVVNTGDVVVRTHQSDASVFTYVVGRGEGMYSWGDPHMDNVMFDAGGEAAFTSSLNGLFQDAKDGTLNNAGLVTAAEQSLATNGRRSNIGDYHADMVLVLGDGRTRVEHDVVGNDIKMNENIDINLLDANGQKMTLTIKEIWAGNGGAGQMSIADTTASVSAQAVVDASDLAVMHEYRGANVRIGVSLFGDDVGTKDYAHIIKSNGQVDYGTGKVSRDGIRAYEAERRGDLSAILSYAFGLNDDEDEANADAKGNVRTVRTTPSTVTPATATA
jgi:hypothetical protein